MSPTRRSNSTCVVLLFFFCFLTGPGVSGLKGQTGEIRQFRAEVPMGDGTRLSTDVYLPRSEGKYPAILIRTPYGSKSHKSTAEAFVRSDYAVVIQNVRGTGGSEGRFVPLENEKSDGIDTLRWVCRQDWNNAKVGFWGASYLAFSGMQIAASGDGCLAAGINISGWTESGRFIFEDGVFRLGDHLPWFAFRAAGRALPEEQMNKAFRTEPLKSVIPMDIRSNMPSNEYDYEKVNIPILHMTGWFDYIYGDTLRTYSELKKRSPGADSQKLIIGHWAHNEIYQKTTTAGDEEFGAEAEFGFEKLTALSIDWFDLHLKGIANEMRGQPNVKYFVMGENRWRSSDRWSPDGVTLKKLYLRPGAKGFSFGVLSSDVPGESSSSSFLFDPNDPVPTLGGANSHFLPWLIGVKDQRFAEQRGDILIFDSAPIATPLILAGPLRAVIYASTEGLDTDFTAKLVEVRPDGYARIIEEGIKRGSSISMKKPGLLEPGKTYRFEIELGHAAIQLQPGSRIRLEVSSSNFPKYTRNPNTGEDPLTATEFKAVRQTVFHSAQYPSQVILPALEPR